MWLLQVIACNKQIPHALACFDGGNMKSKVTRSSVFILRSNLNHLLKVALFISAVFLVGYPTAVKAQSSEATNVDTFVSVKTFVPEELPIRLTNSTLFRTIEGDLLLEFATANTIAERVSHIQYLAMIVDQKGNVKYGQGWRSDSRLEPLTTSKTGVVIKYPVENGEKLVLLAYEVRTESGSFKVAPTDVATELKSKGLIK
jgi:hypothetical protein